MPRLDALGFATEPTQNVLRRAPPVCVSISGARAGALSGGDVTQAAISS